MHSGRGLVVRGPRTQSQETTHRLGGGQRISSAAQFASNAWKDNRSRNRTLNWILVEVLLRYNPLLQASRFFRHGLRQINRHHGIGCEREETSKRSGFDFLARLMKQENII